MSDLLPLFPLPNVVLFPNVFLPLHVFEPRYREMAAVLDEPTGTVKWRTSEDLNGLRILLGEEFREHAIPKTVELGPIS